MQDSQLSDASPTLNEHSMPLTDPPPVTVLPARVECDKRNVNTSGASKATLVEQTSRKAWKYFLLNNGLSEVESHDYMYLFSYIPVKPVIQDGPMCGMVALSMASELAGNSSAGAKEILAEAIRRGLSKQGELFSASALQELAAHFLPCKVECVHLQCSETTTHSLGGRDLVEQLMKRNLILIPYDADKNHGPCQKQGHKAHWALLTGFFAAVKASIALNQLLVNLRMDADIPMLYHWPDDPGQILLDQVIRLAWHQIAEIFVFGHHGKSRHAGCWPLKDLLLSNDNLVDAGPERTTEEYVHPVGGIEAGLKSQMVVVYPNCLKHATSELVS